MREPLTKANKAAQKVITIGETIALVSIIGFFFATFASHLWMNEARPVVLFGDPESIYADPAKAGGTTLVHLPLVVARPCQPVPDEVYRLAQQGGMRLTDKTDGAFPSMGELGVTQPSFRFEAQVPELLEPGDAFLSWRILFDCGLRRVETVTPPVPIVVLP